MRLIKRVCGTHVEGCTLENDIPGKEEELRNCDHECAGCGWHKDVIKERKTDKLVELPNGLWGYITPSARRKNTALNGN